VLHSEFFHNSQKEWNIKGKLLLSVKTPNAAIEWCSTCLFLFCSHLLPRKECEKKRHAANRLAVSCMTDRVKVRQNETICERKDQSCLSTIRPATITHSLGC